MLALVVASLGGSLDSIDDRQYASQRQDGAQDIQPACVRVFVLGEQRGPDDQEQPHDRNGREEHSSPPEVRNDQAANSRPDRTTEGKNRDPDTHGERPLAVVPEHVADQR